MNLFDHAFLINLKHRTDRLVLASQELKKAGIEFELVEGIFDTTETRGTWKTSHRGIGCTKSHQKCINIAEKRQYKNVLIIEDDVLFSEDFNTEAEQAIKQLNNLDWDLFYFYHYGRAFAKISEHICAIKGTPRTHFFAIDQKMYNMILSLDPLDRPIDIFLSKIKYFKTGNKIKKYSTLKNIVFQREGFSDIENRFIGRR